MAAEATLHDTSMSKPGSKQRQLRVCSEVAQSVFRVCSEFAQNVLKGSSEEAIYASPQAHAFHNSSSGQAASST
jgi:hypothetical protein